MAQTRCITAHAAVVAVVVAVLCLAGANNKAEACHAMKSNCQLPNLPPVQVAPGTPPPSAKWADKCPIDVVKLGVCASVLDGLVHTVVGKASPNKEPCCRLIAGLADAAVCVCLAIKANVLRSNHDVVPVDLSLLFHYCRR